MRNNIIITILLFLSFESTFHTQAMKISELDPQLVKKCAFSSIQSFVQFISPKTKSNLSESERNSTLTQISNSCRSAPGWFSSLPEIVKDGFKSLQPFSTILRIFKENPEYHLNYVQQQEHLLNNLTPQSLVQLSQYQERPIVTGGTYPGFISLLKPFWIFHGSGTNMKECEFFDWLTYSISWIFTASFIYQFLHEALFFDYTKSVAKYIIEKQQQLKNPVSSLEPNHLNSADFANFGFPVKEGETESELALRKETEKNRKILNFVQKKAFHNRYDLSYLPNIGMLATFSQLSYALVDGICGVSRTPNVTCVDNGRLIWNFAIFHLVLFLYAISTEMFPTLSLWYSSITKKSFKEWQDQKIMSTRDKVFGKYYSKEEEKVSVQNRDLLEQAEKNSFFHSLQVDNPYQLLNKLYKEEENSYNEAEEMFSELKSQNPETNQIQEQEQNTPKKKTSKKGGKKNQSIMTKIQTWIQSLSDPEAKAEKEKMERDAKIAKLKKSGASPEEIERVMKETSLTQEMKPFIVRLSHFSTAFKMAFMKSKLAKIASGALVANILFWGVSCHDNLK